MILYGEWITQEKSSIKDVEYGDEVIYMIYEDHYTKMVSYPSMIAKYYKDIISNFNINNWSFY